MATLVPPPSKRQKREETARAQQQQDVFDVPEDAGTLRTRFVDENGESATEYVNIPIANLTPKHMNILLNTLLENDPSEYESYSITIRFRDGLTFPVDRNLPEKIYKAIVQQELDKEADADAEFRRLAVFRVEVPTRQSFTPPSHQAIILSGQFAPGTSSRLVTGSGDSTARIWDCETGTCYRKLEGHAGPVLAVSWSHDGSKVATAGMDSTIRLWDAATGKQIGRPMAGHKKWVRNMAWEPFHVQQPGIPRLVSTSKDMTARIWYTNTQTTDLVLSGHTASVGPVRWGVSGLIYTGSDNGDIKVWDVAKGTLRFNLKLHSSRINRIALSYDFVLRTSFHEHGKRGADLSTEEAKRAMAKSLFEKASMSKGSITERLIVACDDCTLSLWEPLTSQKPIRRMTGHRRAIIDVCFSPDGRTIASGSLDNSAKLWNAQDGEFKRNLRGHVKGIQQCSFSPDSRYLVTAGLDTTVKVWDVEKGTMSKDLIGHKDEICALDWSPDGKRIHSGGKDRKVQIWSR